ncbi:MAG TPA: hypothetical protein VD767_01100 [Thermomicrobiales bacterium]|nr:hypothetical protein [Thermomicrobiales bacterium]
MPSTSTARSGPRRNTIRSALPSLTRLKVGWNARAAGIGASPEPQRHFEHALDHTTDPDAFDRLSLKAARAADRAGSLATAIAHANAVSDRNLQYSAEVVEVLSFLYFNTGRRARARDPQPVPDAGLPQGREPFDGIPDMPGSRHHELRAARVPGGDRVGLNYRPGSSSSSTGTSRS